MSTLVVVEGLTDVAFFKQLDQRYGLGLEPLSEGGESKIPGIVRGLVNAGTARLVIAEDLNHRTSAQIIDSHRDSLTKNPESKLYGQLATTLSPTGDRFLIGGCTIAVFPMGLPDDPYLKRLSITSHAMEDFLLSLLFQDQLLLPPGLTPHDFTALLGQLVPAVRAYGLRFGSSKELFQLAKPVVKHGFSDTGAVESLFNRASGEILDRVMAPLVASLREAVV